MRSWFRFLGVCVAATALLARGQGRTRLPSPPPTFTVGGYQSDYQSIQDAVSAAPEEGALIRIRPGVYREIVQVVRPGIHLYGDPANPAKVTLIFNSSTPTLAVKGDDFLADGITITNDSGRTALALNADRAILRHTHIQGNLTLAGSRQYFENCTLDRSFLSGDARAVFSACTLRNVWGTAGFLFDRCRFEGAGRPLSDSGRGSSVFLLGQDSWDPEKVH